MPSIANQIEKWIKRAIKDQCCNCVLPLAGIIDQKESIDLKWRLDCFNDLDENDDKSLTQDISLESSVQCYQIIRAKM